jgi:hypothetical protein
MVWMDNSRIGLREDWHSYPDYDDYRTRNTTFQDLAIFNGTSRTFAGAGEPERLQGAHGSPTCSRCSACRRFEGARSPDAENVTGANNVVVISHALWVRRFAAKDDALESTMQLNGRPVRIIGVMPPGFDFPGQGHRVLDPHGSQRHPARVAGVAVASVDRAPEARRVC